MDVSERVVIVVDLVQQFIEDGITQVYLFVNIFKLIIQFKFITGETSEKFKIERIIDHIKNNDTLDTLDDQKGPFAVVLTATRETALQILTDCSEACRNNGIRVCLIIGRVPQEIQYNDLSSMPDLIIATPGRLLRLMIDTDKVNFDRCSYLALHEIETMSKRCIATQVKMITQKVNDNCKIVCGKGEKFKIKKQAFDRFFATVKG